MVVIRKLRNIEHWLAWAFRDELPKAGSGTVGGGAIQSSWMASFSDLGELGTMIDRVNRFGCVVDHGVEAEPHADALAIGAAVLGLADVSFDPPAGLDLLSDVMLADGTLPTAAEKADAMARGLGRAGLGAGRMPGVVVAGALLGRGPRLGERPEGLRRREVLGPQGGTRWFRRATMPAGERHAAYDVEVEGYDKRNGRPFPGAYRKFVLAPDLAGLVAERAEWQAWVLALAELAAVLDGTLSGPVETSEQVLFPWEAVQEGVVGDDDDGAANFGPESGLASHAPRLACG